MSSWRRCSPPLVTRRPVFGFIPPRTASVKKLIEVVVSARKQGMLVIVQFFNRQRIFLHGTVVQISAVSEIGDLCIPDNGSAFQVRAAWSDSRRRPSLPLFQDQELVPLRVPAGSPPRLSEAAARVPLVPCLLRVDVGVEPRFLRPLVPCEAFGLQDQRA